MGLLDEAIREHLELKRRRGADPRMVAREEREALAPVFPEEHDDSQDNLVGEDTSEIVVAGSATGALVDANTDRHADGAAEASDLSTVGQETAELDMQAVMEEYADTADGAPPVAPALDQAPGGAHGSAPRDEPSFEREASTDAGQESKPEDVPGQERLSFD